MYKHTQTSPLHWLLHGFAILTVALQAVVPVGLVPTTMLLLTAGLLVFLGFCFRELTVRVDEAELLVQFGPLPVFVKRISIADIGAVKAGRSSWIDGWGIHYVPGRGWTYNLWGFDCVELDVNGKRFRVGTDDRANLAEVLSTKTAAI